MLSEDSIIFITFLLAIIGYTGLTITLLLSLPAGRQVSKRKFPFLFWRIIAAIILLHVIMVWAYHYDWQFSYAVRNGYFGFILFHSALLIILISLVVKERIVKILLRLSFIIVTIGAVGAVFRYDIVAIYKVPVILCATAGSGGLGWLFYEKRKK